MCTGRAGRYNRMVRPFKSIFDAHLSRDQIDQCPRNKEWRNPPRTSFVNQQSRFGNGLQTAYTRSDHHAGALKIRICLRHPSTVLHSLLSGGHTKKNEIVNFSPLFGLQIGIAIKGAIRPITQWHFAGVFRNHIAGIEFLNHPCTGGSCEQTLPGRFNPIRQRRYHSKPSYYDTTHLDLQF